MSTDVILKALAGLDPTNDGHWTSDDLPRLDVVKAATGIEVTRATLTQVAKGFTRKNPELPGAPKPAPQPVTGQEAGSEEQAGTGMSEDEAIEAEFLAAKANLEQAQRRMHTATRAMDAVIDRKAREDSGQSTMADIKAFQKSEADKRAKNMVNMQKLAQMMAEANLK